jgi:gamma-glutamyltranspeptidase/glutathione hydrolase
VPQHRPDHLRALGSQRNAQPDLARTLKQIAAQGPSVFYHGEIGAEIAECMAHDGGLVTRADLAAYAPQLRPALRGHYRGLEVISFPPPSSGGAT